MIIIINNINHYKNIPKMSKISDITNLSTLTRAMTFAADKHHNQKRKNKEQTPYINHPIRVVNLLTGIGKITDIPTLCAAVLHDTIEDTGTKYGEIKQEFGEEIADMVREVTDDKSLSKIERKRLQIKNAPHKSTGAKLVKLADKLDNLLDLNLDAPVGWSADAVHGYFVWAYKVVEGLRGTNAGLEDALDALFQNKLVDGEDLDKSLENYYQLLESN